MENLYYIKWIFVIWLLLFLIKNRIIYKMLELMLLVNLCLSDN